MQPECLIADDSTLKSLALTFSTSVKIGHMHRTVNPTFEGYFNEMPLIKCDAIVPVIANSSACSMKYFDVGNFQDSRCILSRSRTIQFELKKSLVCDTSCKLLCDNRHGVQCY